MEAGHSKAPIQQCHVASPPTGPSMRSAAPALTLAILLCLQTIATPPQDASNSDSEEVIVEYYNDTLGSIMDGGGLRIEMASSAPQHLLTRCCIAFVILSLHSV
ncbi:unnamed protein product [Taenia asiatica]|uniref:Neur_chan_LBD domain-containing protein n=1 Tax=Taenia asiatica TaxID=60517 RepID=A0A0R3VZ82_TAEAS|nr:unnamed protein product [Taenia asiatica]